MAKEQATKFYVSDTRVEMGGDTIDTSDTVPAGAYNILTQPYRPPFLKKVEFERDGLVHMPSFIATDIIKDIGHFLSEETKAAFKKYKMVYKRGVLLHGKPGTGKTCIVHQVIDDAIHQDMITIIGSAPRLLEEMVRNIRRIEGRDRPFLVVWEEFEDWVDDYEHELLGLLDGVNQLGNMFYIATTNYLNNVPPRIRSRPSRFTSVIEVGALNAPARKAFLESRIHPDDNVDITEWVGKTAGLNIDQLKDVTISVLVLGLSLEDACQKISELGK